jgi:hypothetical protein
VGVGEADRETGKKRQVDAKKRRSNEKKGLLRIEQAFLYRASLSRTGA